MLGCILVIPVSGTLLTITPWSPDGLVRDEKIQMQELYALLLSLASHIEHYDGIIHERVLNWPPIVRHLLRYRIYFSP